VIAKNIFYGLSVRKKITFIFIFTILSINLKVTTKNFGLDLKKKEKLPNTQHVVKNPNHSNQDKMIKKIHFLLRSQSHLPRGDHLV